MVYLKEELCKFKGDVKTAIYRWSTTMIDSLFAGKAGLEPVAYYAKNGISNAIDRYDEQMNRYIDLAVEYGAGEIVVFPPDNPLVNMIFPWQSVKITTEDILKIRSFF